MLAKMRASLIGAPPLPPSSDVGAPSAAPLSDGDAQPQSDLTGGHPPPPEPQASDAAAASSPPATAAASPPTQHLTAAGQARAAARSPRASRIDPGTRQQHMALWARRVAASQPHPPLSTARPTSPNSPGRGSDGVVAVVDAPARAQSARLSSPERLAISTAHERGPSSPSAANPSSYQALVAVSGGRAGGGGSGSPVDSPSRQPLSRPSGSAATAAGAGHGASGTHGTLRAAGRVRPSAKETGPLYADPSGAGFAYGGVHPGTLHAHGKLHQTHAVSYSLGRAGSYLLHVALRGQGRVLPGSPFALTVVPSVAHAARTHFAPRALPLLALADGSWSEIVVVASRDSFGNRCIVGGAGFGVTCDDLSVDCACKDCEDGTYLVQWRRAVPDARLAEPLPNNGEGSQGARLTSGSARVPYVLTESRAKHAASLSVTIDGAHVLGSPAPLHLPVVIASSASLPAPDTELSPEPAAASPSGETATGDAMQSQSVQPSHEPRTHERHERVGCLTEPGHGQSLQYDL